jgi:Glyoxalase superfamily protein/Clp amino terminal domain, pathogenicity island component
MQALASRSVQAKDHDMRDFRDAKAMAHTLRAALALKGLEITISQSLELIAEVFGVADWNTLAAAIRRETPARESPSPRRLPAAAQVPAQESGRPTEFSATLERALHRAIAEATRREHEYATLEHLLLALIDDVDALAVMEACAVDLAALKADLVYYIDNDLKALVTDDHRDSRPTAAFQRVLQRAKHHVQSLGRDTMTGVDLLVAMFYEKESPAAWLLGERGMTHQDATNFTLHSIRKGSGKPAA